MMKQLSIFSVKESMTSQILCCVSERFIIIQIPTKLGRKGLNGSRLTKVTETMTKSIGSRLNSSGTFSQDSQCCSSAVKSQIYWVTMEKHQKLSQEEFFLRRYLTSFPMTVMTMKKNVWQMLKSSKSLQRDLALDNCKFIGSGSEKKWYSMEENSPQGILDHIADEMLLELEKSGYLIFCATTSLSKC